jgi:superfamily I DNA and RNA helicase
MAIIFPEEINDFVNKTDGEKRVFDILKNHLLPNDEYMAWYEPKLQGRNQQILKPDFIVWGNNIGLIILEVKDWSLDRIKEWNNSEVKFKDGKSYKNPERQAIDYINSTMTNMKRMTELVNQYGVHKGKLKFPCSYGIVLTNITSTEFLKSFGKVINSDKILFSDDLFKIEDRNSEILNSFLRKVSSLFRFNVLNQSEIDALRSVLFPRVIINPDVKNQSIKILDKEQEQEAWKIGSGHRIIKGVAGSGKTLLIAYRAKILKALHPNFKILIICYNITLRNYIRTKIDEIMNEVTISTTDIDIYHFHDFAFRVIRKQMTSGDNIIRNIGPQTDWNVFQSKLSKILMDGIQKNEIKEGQYDAILIDECQDLTTDFLKFLLHLLNKQTDHLLIAIDPAQNLYGGRITWKEVGIKAKGRVKALKRTYRNTKQILEFAFKFNPERIIKLSETDTEVPLFPELAQRKGDKPKIMGFKNTGSLIDYVINSIKELRKKKFSLGDIGIIYQSNKFEYYNDLKNKLSFENILYKEIITKEDKEHFDINSNEVKLIGIHNVKGYEFYSVFLIGVDYIYINTQEMINLLYVGITRATDELYIPYLNININNGYVKKIISISNEN